MPEASDEGVGPFAGALAREQDDLGGTAAVGAGRTAARGCRLGIAGKAAALDALHVGAGQERAHASAAPVLSWAAAGGNGTPLFEQAAGAATAKCDAGAVFGM